MMEIISFRKEIADLLRNITDNMEATFGLTSEKLGLTMLQMHILMEIRQHGEYTIGNLAKRVGVAGGNASALCKKLQQEGFLSRKRDDNDERVVHIVLTPKGEESIDWIEKKLQEKYAPFFLGQSEGDIQDILCGLYKLNRLLEKMKIAEQNKEGF